MVDTRDSEPVVDVVPLIENQKAGRFWVVMFVVAWAVTFLDGFDLQIISFAGRYIQEAFALSNTQLGTLGTLLGGTSVAKFGAMLGPWLAGFAMDSGLDARGTFFVFAFFPVAMVALLVVLGRVQRRLPIDADGSLHAPAGVLTPR